MRSLLPTSCALLVGLLAGLALAEPPATIVGTWRLAEQTYERGQRNLAPQDPPTRLVVRATATGVAVTITTHGLQGAWPLYPSPDGPRPLEHVRTWSDPARRELAARYVVLPVEGDDTRLEVTESYRIDEHGRLAGTMTLHLVRRGEDRGGFTWKRLFVREGS